VRRPEWCAKISAALKGRKLSPEHCAKLSAAHKGKKHSAASRAKISVALKGIKRSAETRAKMSTFQKNRGHKPLSTKHRAHISAALKGYKRPPHSAEHRAKIAATLKGRYGGSKNPAWRGGISREPYGWEWNDELREEVRRRDGYKCQLCGVSQTECEKILDVHHVNYNKRDNDPLNLVCLCRACHVRTNHRRKYWQARLQALPMKRKGE